MDKLFVPYKLSLRLKENKYNSACFAYYDKDGVIWYFEKDDFHSTFSKNFIGEMSRNRSSIDPYENFICTAPIYQEVIDWFRDKHGIQLFSDYSYNDGFHYGYKWVKYNGENGEWWRDNNGESADGFDTEREALINAIEEAFKLID